MNVLILNASPRSKGSASAFYSSLLRLFLTGCEVKVNPLRGARDYGRAFELLPWADAVVISAPVYVDAAPAHITAFLEQAAPLTARTIFSCYSSMLVTLVMSLGAVICLAVMGHRIKHGAIRKNLFTRCLMPSFLFIPVSDIFMLLSALAHGNLPHTLFRRHKCPAQEKGTHL